MSIVRNQEPRPASKRVPELLSPLRTTGWRGVLAAGRRRLRFGVHYLRWRPRFAAFGWASVLKSPALLTNSRRVRIGRRVEIRPGARIEAIAATVGRRDQIVIGDHTSIHLHFHVGAALRVEIGRNVLIAGHVFVTDHDHALPVPGLGRSTELSVAPTRIGDDCWLGEGCKVLKGVDLGPGCVVAANAVVTRSFPAYSLVAGVPARLLRRYDEKQAAWVPATEER